MGSLLDAVIAARKQFETWSVDSNQGYILARHRGGAMRSYEDIKTEHAWRGFCAAWLLNNPVI